MPNASRENPVALEPAPLGEPLLGTKLLAMARLAAELHLAQQAEWDAESPASGVELRLAARPDLSTLPERRSA